MRPLALLLLLATPAAAQEPEPFADWRRMVFPGAPAMLVVYQDRDARQEPGARESIGRMGGIESFRSLFDSTHQHGFGLRSGDHPNNRDANRTDPGSGRSLGEGGTIGPI